MGKQQFQILMQPLNKYINWRKSINFYSTNFSFWLLSFWLLSQLGKYCKSCSVQGTKPSIST